MTTEIGCTGEWNADVARSLYLQMVVEEAEKKGAEASNANEDADDDTSRLDELISLADKMPAEASKAHEDEDDDTGRLDELISLADKMAAEDSNPHNKKKAVVVEVDEEMEWYSQHMNAIDAAEAAYMMGKANKDTGVGTSRNNEVVVED